MTANDELPVMLVEHHLCDIRREHVPDDTDRLTRTRIPDLDAPLAGHEYFQALLAEQSAANWLIISELWDERPCIFKDRKGATTADKAAMLWHGLDAFDFVRVRHVKSLDTAVIHYTPKLHHALLVGCDEAVQIW